ncbi:NCS2 family permease [Carboxylicivirga sediminis]|uniref:NCS2 family permease n=1 Tax=Carboxylicivirga sediminis TaxID=2006564 RepID=A0A941IZK0_9BACT|nr:NCS2 family permease [Carboxylicivirga sediminis]MBR8537404.1 NCS2 family permease [Carboxylicivirga sediminis]
MLEKFFKLSENKTTVKTEIVAGITTFMTMAYILAVNPDILSATGMDKGALFTATAISAAIGTLVMALWAKLPFALAPGMGLNAFFAFGVCIGMGMSWQFALTAVFLEGILFILMTVFNIRELIINAIPGSIKNAISVGIGLFIAFIGMKNAGIIVAHDATFVHLGDMKSGAVLLALGGIVITGVLLALKVKGALLIGMVATTVVGLPLGVTQLPHFDFSVPSISSIAWQFDWSWLNNPEGIFTMITVLFTFLFVDMFDTVGTLIGVSTKAKMINEDGRIPNVKQALMADSIGTTVGAALGTSTVTTYVESAAGVAEGGRTGLTALTTAVLFIFALFLSPLFLMIPAAATAPALVLVGVMMMTPIQNLDLDDFTESIPAFFTLVMMPLTFSIAEGIVFGILSYVILKLLTGKFKDISIISYILAVLFIMKFIFM